jgi:histidinol-phosphate aminotransferase
VRSPADFNKNILPYLSHLEDDEAGPNPSEIARRYGIPEECIVMLSRNENPYGASPRVRMALENVTLHRYPESRPFLRALAGYTGYSEECIVAGAGMDEIITTICRIFLGPGEKAFIPVPTYNLYGLAVQLCGAKPLFLPRLEDFSEGPEIPENIKMAFLCSPNNPTGNALSEEGVRSIVEGTDAIVFLDEAYAEFARKSLLKLVKEYDNLVVGRTLSKAFGLAGLRLGYAVAPPWIAEQYRRAAPLFSISSLSLAAGVAALQDLDWMRKCVGKIVSERERIMERLACVHPSEGNFLYIHTRERSKVVTQRLLHQGVIVRDCSSFPGSGEHCMRVTVGTPEENDCFLEEYEEASAKLSK